MSLSIAPVPDDGAVEPPLDAAGCDAAALELGDGVLAPLHADTTIATTANGAARRKNVCFLVNVDSPLIVVTGIAGRGPHPAGVGAIRSPPVAIAPCRGDGRSEVARTGLPVGGISPPRSTARQECDRSVPVPSLVCAAAEPAAEDSLT
jgi:hypothetical protein